MCWPLNCILAHLIFYGIIIIQYWVSAWSSHAAEVKELVYKEFKKVIPNKWQSWIRHTQEQEKSIKYMSTSIWRLMITSWKLMDFMKNYILEQFIVIISDSESNNDQADEGMLLGWWHNHFWFKVSVFTWRCTEGKLKAYFISHLVQYRKWLTLASCVHVHAWERERERHTQRLNTCV